MSGFFLMLAAIAVLNVVLAAVLFMRYIGRPPEPYPALFEPYRQHLFTCTPCNIGEGLCPEGERLKQQAIDVVIAQSIVQGDGGPGRPR